MSINAKERHETIESAYKTLRNGQERSGTVKTGQERSGTVRNGERSGTVNGQERLGPFESDRSNAMEQIVGNCHGTVTFTFQKRKKHCYIKQKILLCILQ
jgi:hypothetical protein